MALLKIRKYGDPVLRQKAVPVTVFDEELATLVKDMFETMYAAPGVGLAAPQVGKSIRMMVIDVSEKENLRQPYVFINPEILPETDLICEEEGCLSVPGIYAQVQRAQSITVKALDVKGQPFELKGIGGLLGRCIQHEMDHLDGILFVDKLRPTDKLLFESKLKKIARQSKRP